MNLCIATPTMHKLVSAGYAKTIAAIGMVCAKHSIPFAIVMSDTSFIVDARNSLVVEFLKNPDRTHLLMIDSDSELGFAAVEKLLTCDFPFASIPFCTRQIDLEALWLGGAEEVPFQSALAGAFKWCLDLADNNQQVQDGWIKARRTGFGCVLLQRSVLEGVAGQYGWFDRMVDPNPPGDLLSEDMSFCERVRDIATPMLCVDQVALHNGTFSFGARLLDDQRFFKRG